MKLLVSLIILISFGNSIFAQNNLDTLTDGERSLENEFDLLVKEWESLSEDLKTYSGLQTYCGNDEYKANLVGILGLVHHYDSLVLDIINSPEEMAKLDPKEQRKTLAEIEAFESEYNTPAFVMKLQDECKFRKDIERHKDESKTDFGANSYDGQILILETDLRKYVKHIDSRLEHIDDHVHKLHIDNVREYRPLEDER